MKAYRTHLSRSQYSIFVTSPILTRSVGITMIMQESYFYTTYNVDNTSMYKSARKVLYLKCSS